MEQWLDEALKEKRIVPLKSLCGADGIYCLVHEHEWYEGGVVMDWTALHRGLKPNTVAFDPHTLTREVMSFVTAEAGEGASLVTSLELDSPWYMISLSEQAQRFSAFTPTNRTNGALCEGARAKTYTFVRGPPGLRSVRDDLVVLLKDVRRQLCDSGLRCHIFLSSVLVASDDFERLLHHTASVFRALRSAGFAVKSVECSFEPRRVLRTTCGRYWNTMSLSSMQCAEDVAAFLVDLFYLWLGDCYTWLCEPPSPALLAASGDERGKLDFFRRFCTQFVLPRREVVEFAFLAETNLNDLLPLARPLLQHKVPRIGPQKWSALELRLCLCALEAYEHPLSS
ncbi:hypothetical protein ERJ75_000320500 [Trypanosoma vivax]|uniref:Uncharacterized protein n=1 Tax=Trypanosoma vivax (strain Y486) TaxID=1055687 RepID=G0UA92_TRYVY|nr:hypothetical protein TRVL_04423 [Trypanosoma vivax]KAH8617991.1 hypothetical protein ERJ75_000320500 [Trypanosoma vivax]CCC52724.1 conserved hypothetical protein [Trypanosoma vivax Y486]